MDTRNTFALAAMAMLIASPTLAQEDRYRLERTDNGYVRLDTETGRMSTCREQGEQLICRMATEDHAAYEADISALERRIEALEKTVTSLGGSVRSNDLPSEEEFEQTLGYMERFFRRFMGIVGEMDRSLGTEERKEPLPDRT